MAARPPPTRGGIAGSAGVVTSAAVIMVAVFSIFATLSFIDVKMLGVERAPRARSAAVKVAEALTR